MKTLINYPRNLLINSKFEFSQRYGFGAANVVSGNNGRLYIRDRFRIRAAVSAAVAGSPLERTATATATSDDIFGVGSLQDRTLQVGVSGGTWTRWGLSQPVQRNNLQDIPVGQTLTAIQWIKRLPGVSLADAYVSIALDVPATNNAFNSFPTDIPVISTPIAFNDLPEDVWYPITHQFVLTNQMYDNGIQPGVKIVEGSEDAGLPTGDFARIAGLQVLEGAHSAASHFTIYRSQPGGYSQEFIKCLRYFQFPNWATAQAGRITIPFGVQMRATPAITFISTGGVSLSIDSVDTFALTLTKDANNNNFSFYADADF